MAAGEFARVRHHLELGLVKALDIRVAAGGEHDLYAMLVDTAVRDRDMAQLTHYAPLAEETAVRNDHKLYRAIADRAWAVILTQSGEYDKAEVRLAQAETLFTELDAQWQLGRCLFERGQLELARGTNQAARIIFTQALNRFDAIGAIPFSSQTREILESIH